MAVLKIGRHEVDINENDVLLFNGCCWMVLTRQIFRGFHYAYLPISKSLCNKFIKNDIIFMTNKSNEYVTQDGQKMGLYYYKFNMDNLEKYLESLKN